MATSDSLRLTNKASRYIISLESLPEWVSDWATFVSKLHGRALIVNCGSEDCDAEIRLTRDDVDEDGVTIDCPECDYVDWHWPDEWVQGLRDSGVSLE